MPNRKISQFPVVTQLSENDIFLINKLNSDGSGSTTSTINFSAFKSNLASGSTNTNSTSFGGASAGIFTNAVCFIPSDKGTGSWTCPLGVYSARVTVVGGGGCLTGNGGRSHFNYPSGSSPVKNQLFADGGGSMQYIINVNNPTLGLGGNAGWNGIVAKTRRSSIGETTTVYAYAEGKCGNNGVGGAGGPVVIRTVASTIAILNPQNQSWLPSISVYVDGKFKQALNCGGSYGRYGFFGGGGSGGINGNGSPIITTATRSTVNPAITYNSFYGGFGGGCLPLSMAAYSLPNLSKSLETLVGQGFEGAGGGWATAIVETVPNQSYSYAVGVGGKPTGSNIAANGADGMVVIEW